MGIKIGMCPKRKHNVSRFELSRFRPKNINSRISLLRIRRRLNLDDKYGTG